MLLVLPVSLNNAGATMRMSKHALVWFILLLTAGCASMPDPIDPATKIATTKGVLLAAITSDGSPQVMDAWFFYRKRGTTDERRLDAFGMAGLIMKPNDFGGTDSRMGRLIALPLESGEYELFSWTLYVTRLGGYGYISPKTPPPPHLFTIKPGEVTYLGGLHIDTILGKNTFGVSLAFGGNPDVTDQSARDLPLLKTKYPNLANWPVQTSVPDGRQWKLPQ